MNDQSKKQVVVLGSTGSIGQNALEVIAALPEHLRLAGISAHQSIQKLECQAERYKPDRIVITREDYHPDVFPEAYIETGVAALIRLCQQDDVDIVLNAIVGSAGLRGSLATIESGKTLALANKETLVMAGSLVMELSKKQKATIIPVDSEHSAIFQIIAECGKEVVERVVLTASGGPFRGRQARDLESITPEEALRHPTWQMGRKITIDSATLMNKALEVIEARWLFDLAPEQIDVIIHPESIIHSFVEFKDGSVLAQLSPPDMRLPIQYALTYPNRYVCPTRKLSWTKLKALTFMQPDRVTFPALDLGYEVAKKGGTSGAVLNAANEVAVARFLEGTLRFTDIALSCREVLESHTYLAQPTLDELIQADQWARQEMNRWKKP